MIKVFGDRIGYLYDLKEFTAAEEDKLIKFCFKDITEVELFYRDWSDVLAEHFSSLDRRCIRKYEKKNKKRLLWTKKK